MKPMPEPAGPRASEAEHPSAALARRLDGRPAADVLVPDGTPLQPALARTTDLGIGAHPDDLELLMLVPIGLCRGSADRWFAGVTATDGAGSTRTGRFADLSDDALVAVRRAEQREAGALGGYGALVQLGHPSAAVRGGGGGQDDLVEDLVELLRASRPLNVYTHDLADKHPTHVAVAATVVRAIRSLPEGERPLRLVGVEGWRDLDWLADHEKVVLDATGYGALGRRLAACFASQIEDAKPYDRAVEGRRWANATLSDPRALDQMEAVSVAMDLSPLIRNDHIDPVAYVAAAADRFRRDIETTVAAAFGR
jgi:LmbE family N-acetylglucosaminyl deacetylase